MTAAAAAAADKPAQAEPLACIPTRMLSVPFPRRRRTNVPARTPLYRFRPRPRSSSPSMSLGTGFGSYRAWSVASSAGMDAGA